MAFNLSPIGGAGQQFFTDQGVVLSGGLIYTYIAGTTIPQSTYATAAGTVANANPIVLNSDGRVPTDVWLTSGSSYKFIITTAQAVPLTPSTYDYITGINDLTAINTQSEWVSVSGTLTYISTTQFSIPGNQTSIFTAHRRIKASVTAGQIYGNITTSSFATGITTVTIVWDSVTLDTGLSVVSVSLINPTNSSLPDVISSGTAVPLTFQTGGSTRLTIDTSGNITATGTVTANGVVLGNGIGGFRNYIINGSCKVAQRGSIGPVLGVFTYSGADRFCVAPIAFTTMSGTIQQGTVETTQSGFSQYLSVTTTGTGNIKFATRLEAKDVAPLSGKTATLSCTVYQNTGSAVNVSLIMYKATVLDNFTTETACGTPNTNTISVNSGVWTPITLTTALSAADVANGLMPVINFAGLGALTTKAFKVADFQLEEGSVATPFENRPYATELALCQRYYQTIGGTTNSFGVGGYALAGQNVACTLVWPVPMRTTPSIVLPALTSSNTAGMTFNSPNATGCLLAASATATGTVYSYPSGSGVATLSAEL